MRFLLWMKVKNQRCLRTWIQRIDTMGESAKIAAGNGVKLNIKLGADIDKVQTDYIFKTGLKMLGIALLGTVAAISVAFFATKVGAQLAIL